MEHGGRRDSAGRKMGAVNFLTQALRERINAIHLINFLQDLAKGKVEGATVSERKDAAVALLKKVLPDCRQTGNFEQEEPISIKVVLQKENGEEEAVS